LHIETPKVTHPTGSGKANLRHILKVYIQIEQSMFYYSSAQSRHRSHTILDLYDQINPSAAKQKNPLPLKNR
jgi:hypothetical protein